mmetsp:Transcript_9899/g.21756  ORF Transcript_9899/g.21756 Transcript_9899/m.21756 type:complete len:87 (+) Transcript_9899:116-376(+)
MRAAATMTRLAAQAIQPATVHLRAGGTFGRRSQQNSVKLPEEQVTGRLNWLLPEPFHLPRTKDAHFHLDPHPGSWAGTYRARLPQH